MCVYIYEQIQEPITMSNSLLRGIYTLKHIPGVDNPADVMTKALPRGAFSRSLISFTASRIGLASPSSSTTPTEEMTDVPQWR